jgi:hypothetical protein
MSYPEFGEQISSSWRLLASASSVLSSKHLFFCRDPIYRVRDLSFGYLFHWECRLKHALMNHGRDKSGSYRRKKA